MYELNEQQQQIFDKYIAGENIFITGPGGSTAEQVSGNIGTWKLHVP